MPSFRDQLRALQAHPGVRAVVAAGRDGLLIDHAAGERPADDAPPARGDTAAGDATAGEATAYAEHLAALAPGLVLAAEMLADADVHAAARGLRSIVVESEHGVLMAMPVTPDVTVLAAIDAAHADAAAAIGHVRGERAALAAGL